MKLGGVYWGWNVSAAIWYLEGGMGTVVTEGLSAGSRKLGGGLLDPNDGESRACVGLAIVETGEADCSGSV